MPQESRYRRRSRSRSRGKKGRRRRSSDSSYSRSRSRSREKRYHGKEKSRRSPPKYRRSSAHSPRDRKRPNYGNRPHSRSASPAPRHQRQHQKMEAVSNYALDTAKVLGGNFSEIPGLDFIGHGGREGTKKERSFSPQQRRTSQDLDMRLRELESQQSSGGSRARPTSTHPKNESRDYYGPKEPSPERYQQRHASPHESMRYPDDQGIESSRYPKEQGTASDNGRYREQQRPDYGLRVEVKRKQHSPKRSKLDPSLVVIPRRKDEGLRPLFDRPEIIVRVLEDDPELYPEKYERFACWRKSPEPQHDHSKDDRDFGIREEDRPRKHSRGHRDRGRSPSPELPRATTVMMKPFTIFEKYEQSLRSRPAILQELEDSQLSLTSQPQTSLPSLTPPLALDSMLHDSSDLRHDLEVRRNILSDARSPLRGMASDPSHDRRDLMPDRRPVRERLGQVDDGGQEGSSVPDFRKEVEELKKLDPLAEYKGYYFEHDDRDAKSPTREQRGERRPERGRFFSRATFRGRFQRGNFRGGYRGNNFIPGYRGTYRGGFSRPWNRGAAGRGAASRGMASRGFASRGMASRGTGNYWKHDKYEEKTKEREEKRKKREKSEKKEKKSKSSDKKKSKKSKKSPDRAKAKE